MSHKLLAVICTGCHKVRTEEVKPGVFVCRPCGLLIAQGESANSMGHYLPVTYPIQDLEKVSPAA